MGCTKKENEANCLGLMSNLFCFDFFFLNLIKTNKPKLASGHISMVKLSHVRPLQKEKGLGLNLGEGQL